MYYYITFPVLIVLKTTHKFNTHLEQCPFRPFYTYCRPVNSDAFCSIITHSRISSHMPRNFTISPSYP